jgi:hyperosmotically inducible protein
VDAAIARTQQAANEARVRTEALAAEAGAKVKSSEPLVQRGYDNVKEAAQDAGAAVSGSAEDLSITATISATFAKDAMFDAARIDVDTRKGAVTLEGSAPTDEAKARAGGIAKAVPGVVSVDNRVAVKS